MPLNYSKWDKLELSDDSDIEGHPNVDKRSLIRWKQRDIHEKRELRKHTIAKLTAQIACNSVLLPKITRIASDLKDETQTVPRFVYFNSLVEQLEKTPSRECPPTNDPSKLEQTYDGMVLSLLRQVAEEAKNKIKDSGTTESEKEVKLATYLASGVAEHVMKLKETIDKDVEMLNKEEAEQKKHITSEDLHDGFSSKYVPSKAEPAPVPLVSIDRPKMKTSKATEFEVLNPKSLEQAKGDDDDEDKEEEEENLPELTPSLEAFSNIPVRAYETSYEFIQNHRDVFVSGASDALLIAAFRAQTAGKSKYAKQCVHQSLLLQYCDKLGKDGVRVFFQKMINADPRAEKVFVDDLENTYRHLVERVTISQEEEAAGKEQIQLVPENPNQTISFNVPDGAPPDELHLEGPGTEDMDVEEVRKALQFRWNVFDAFPPEFKEALKTGNLDAVNKVLGDMDVPVAESIVQQLDMAGILSFAQGGIRDETLTGKATAVETAGTSS